MGSGALLGPAEVPPIHLVVRAEKAPLTTVLCVRVQMLQGPYESTLADHPWHHVLHVLRTSLSLPPSLGTSARRALSTPLLWNVWNVCTCPLCPWRLAIYRLVLPLALGRRSLDGTDLRVSHPVSTLRMQFRAWMICTALLCSHWQFGNETSLASFRLTLYSNPRSSLVSRACATNRSTDTVPERLQHRMWPPRQRTPDG